jgi:hypothetical protein
MRSSKHNGVDPGSEDQDEKIVHEFLGSSAPARELSDLCDALRLRIRALREEIQRLPEGPERQDLERRVSDARRQLAVLRQEEAISQFVEESVRATLSNDSPSEEELEFNEDWDSG